MEAQRVVTVFGSSRTEEGSAEYEEAYRLGALLARAGLAVCNGGYTGTMAAVSRGAREAGGRTIGIMVDILPADRANPWLDERYQTETLFLRLEKLTTLADAFVVLNGGIGTLVELGLVWNLSFLEVMPEKPIVLVGGAWPPVLEALTRTTHVRDVDVRLLRLAPTVETAVAIVLDALGLPTSPEETG